MLLIPDSHAIMHDGGAEELKLLNQIVREVYRTMDFSSEEAWLTACGVSSSLESKVESLTLQRDVITTYASDELHNLVQNLRKAAFVWYSKPWFRFTVSVTRSTTPKVHYNWSARPQVSDLDLKLDLKLFPRGEEKLPAWYHPICV